MRYPKRSQSKYAESRHRVQNWADYEAGLQKPGALTVWLSDTALDAWRAPATGKPGGQRTYSDLAIEAALTIRIVFRLPLRQTEVRHDLRSAPESLRDAFPGLRSASGPEGSGPRLRSGPMRPLWVRFHPSVR